MGFRRVLIVVPGAHGLNSPLFRDAVRRPATGMGLSILGIVFILALAGPLLTPYTPDQTWSAYFVDTPE